MVGLIEVYWCGWEIMSIMTSLLQAALTLHPVIRDLGYVCYHAAQSIF